MAGTMRALAVLLTLGLLAAPAAAQPAPQVTTAAQPYVDRAMRHFSAREFGKAVMELRAAYAIDPQPALLYAMAQAERMNGDCRQAIRHYEAYLRTAPNERQAVLARSNITRCQSDLKRPPPPGPPASQPTSGAAPPEPPPAPLPPGPPPEPRPAASRGPSWVTDWAGHGLVLGGLAVAATGIALWRIGHHTIDDANAAPDYATFAARAAKATTADREQKAGIATMAVGAALVAAGVIHYALRGRGRPERPHVTAAMSPGGAALLLAGSF